MATKKASTYRNHVYEAWVPGDKKPFVRITREERKKMQEALHYRLTVVEEASRLMSILGISSKVTQVPEWMLGMAAWSMYHGVPNFEPGSAQQIFSTFFEVLRAGWKGDMTTVEMFFLANET